MGINSPKLPSRWENIAEGQLWIRPSSLLLPSYTGRTFLLGGRGRESPQAAGAEDLPMCS